jgi:hypothetical protein
MVEALGRGALLEGLRSYWGVTEWDCWTLAPSLLLGGEQLCFNMHSHHEVLPHHRPKINRPN